MDRLEWDYTYDPDNDLYSIYQEDLLIAEELTEEQAINIVQSHNSAINDSIKLGDRQ